MHKISCTREIESKLSFLSFALSLHKISCTREIESKLSFLSFALSLHKISCIREFECDLNNCFVKVKLHVFNPEHDMALASGMEHMTLPHAIQEFKTNLGFLPALWADNGDFVLVDDVLFALKAVSQLRKPHAEVLFVTPDDLKNLVFTEVSPWGWDKAVRATLAGAGLQADVLPSDGYLSCVKSLSDRRRTSKVLEYLRCGREDVTCGESWLCASLDEVERYRLCYGKIVVKAPWSSSGRGVRYVDGEFSAPMAGWITNVISRQGGVMVEPYYKKVRDFALEFCLHADGRVEYCGLSLFETSDSGYAGNVLATEDEKMRMLAKYLPLSLVGDVRQGLEEYFANSDFKCYVGPLGVDMMVVSRADAGGFLLNPCVEINVRRTMGHVANALRPSADEPSELMRIVHDVNYKLRFERMENCFVKVI